MKKKKVVLIHTSPVSLNDLKDLFHEILPNAEMVNIIDDSLLEEVKNHGGLTPDVIRRMNVYMAVAESMGPDLIFNQCSSVGEAFDLARKEVSCKTLRIDEAMCEKAVQEGSVIGVVATVASTVKPSCDLVYQKAEEIHKKVEVKAYLVNGALDILMKEHNTEKHNQLVKKAIEDAEKECDVVMLAQGSMTAILPCLGKTEKPVLTSPRLAVEKVKEMLEMEN